LIKEQANHELAKKQYLQSETLVEQLDIQVKDLEKALRHNQAGILAKTLQKGSPCPVCGSSHHPSPAQLSSAVTEDEIDDASKKRSAAERKRNEDLKALSAINSRIDTLTESIITIEHNETFDPITFKSNLESDIENRKVSDDSLKAQIESLVSKLLVIEQAKTRKTFLENQLMISKQTIEKDQTSIQELNTNIKVQEGLINNIQVELPKECENLLALSLLIKTKESDINSLESNFKSEKERFDSFQKTYLTSEGELKKSLEQLNTSQLDYTITQNNFEKGLSEQRFETQDVFLDALLSPNEYAILDKKLRTYEQNRNTIDSRINELNKQLEGKQSVDVTPMEESLKQKESEHTNTSAESTAIKQSVKRNKEILGRLKASEKELDGFNEEHGKLNKLFNLTNGKGKLKLSMERYVLSLYFTKILEAANYRMQRISQGRYKFELKEPERGQSVQGLDINVLDYETGKLRDVKSLSGGESFKAALSLALGCSDVIQASSGGVELNTLFIDEGFGSLDPESLTQAMKVLFDLRNDNKMIAVISHVQEMKEQIPSKLVIEKLPKGSRIRSEIR
jgi:DNA repair protein SbcC/Rad50